jgi:hypothetical protein
MVNPLSGGEGRSINGPLAELVNGLANNKSKQTSRRRPNPHDRRFPGGSKTHFLAELEVSGDPTVAARTAQCTLAEVRSWRAADQMFERDYVLALIGHLKALKRMVHEMSQRHESPQVRLAAQHLLATEPRYVGSDGRLDARAWRDALASFAHSLGVDLAWWEPAGEEEAGQQSAPESDSSAA